MVVGHLALFIAALILGSFLTWFVRNTAIAHGRATGPSFVHHLHTDPIPRLGGVAIYLSFVTLVAVSGMLAKLLHVQLGFSLRTILYVLLPATVVFLLGLWDDLKSLSPYAKFAVQILAAGLLYVGGLRIVHLPAVFGARELGWTAGLALTILWVLLITNAFNLLDGLDGLAAGSALFSTLTVFVVSLVNNSHLVSLLTAILAGAILAFLRFNFHPATIFLGDCGSLFIGFTLSALALTPGSEQKAPMLVAVAIPVVSFGLPILDTSLSVARRFLSGQPLFSADREHIHHKLLQRGLTQRQVVVLLYGVSALFGLLSLFMLYPGRGAVGVVLFVVGVGIWIGVQHLGYHEFFELRRVAQRTLEQKQVIINNLAIRRATERLATVKDLGTLCETLQQTFAVNDFDGFQLSVETAGAESPLDGDLTPGPNGDLHYKWKKPGKRGDGEAPAAWSLRLDLVTSRKQKQGVFFLYRGYSDRPLLVDVNLLTAEFPQALADAADRAVRHAAQNARGAAAPADDEKATSAFAD